MPTATNLNETSAKTKTATASPRGNGKYSARNRKSAKVRAPGRRKHSAAVESANESYGQRATRLAGRGREALGDAYSWAGSAASNLGAPDMDSMRRMANERPLLLGAIGLGVGLLLGAMWPATRAVSMHMMPTARRGGGRRRSR